ncbi:MAG: cytochrome c oxidase subunit 2 [Actinomycetota bacterium]|jgi:cytochrome c oxidase subunit 2|nr:MAG: cytochrome c oxidase subunit 2 [Actinomycetota bacterium]
MKSKARWTRSWPLALVLAALALSACSDPNLPQNTFAPAGPVARKQADLFWPVFWVAVGVFLVVEGGIVWMAIRFRHRRDRDRFPAQIHGNSRLEVGWTILPAVVIAVIMVPTVSLIWDLARPAGAGALNVTAEGHQWWWGFRYTDEDMRTSYDQPIVTADVLVIPVGRDVSLSLESAGGLIGGGPEQADYAVIHSFWVPRLAGKQDVVPGRTNRLVLRADEPGTYWGQCAEFCGLQHAQMRFRVVALPQAEWERWVANQKRPAVTPTDPEARRGMDLFLNGVSGGGQCIACHAVGGTEAASPAGPNLTHFADPTHECFAGCIWETSDRAALEEWLRNPTQAKLGSKMPDYNLTEDEIDALVAYLYSLT